MIKGKRFGCADWRQGHQLIPRRQRCPSGQIALAIGLKGCARRRGRNRERNAAALRRKSVDNRTYRRRPRCIDHPHLCATHPQKITLRRAIGQPIGASDAILLRADIGPRFQAKENAVALAEKAATEKIPAIGVGNWLVVGQRG